MTQLNYFLQDCRRMLGKNKWRVLILWMHQNFWGLFLYRFERSLFLIFKESYKYIRILFLPFFTILKSFSNIDIHYRATIKGGVLVLHPSVGCVISGKAKIGKNLTLTGGNIIGFNKKSSNKKFEIGDYCTFGANAVAIGPVVIGNHSTIGASACVVSNFEENNQVLVGVPAKKIK